MIAAPKSRLSAEAAKAGIFSCAEHCSREGEASISEGEMGKCTQRTRRGTDPSTYIESVEIMSGNAVAQAETCDNLQRPEGLGKTEANGRTAV